MFSYIAHAGHSHASESANNNFVVIGIAVAVFVLFVAAIVIFDKKRASKLKGKDDQ